MKDQTTDFVNYATELHSVSKEYFDALFRVHPGKEEKPSTSTIVWCAEGARDEYAFSSIPTESKERELASAKWFGMMKKLSELRGLNGFMAFYIIPDKADRDLFEDYIEIPENEQDAAKAVFNDSVVFMRDYCFVPVLCVEHKQQKNENGNPHYTHYHILFVSKYQVGTKKYEETMQQLQSDLQARGSKILDGQILD